MAIELAPTFTPPTRKRVHIIDSHTGGEPTRLVIDGGPELGAGPIRERLNVLRYRHDDFRKSVILEPRGSDVIVGALLCEPHDPSCTAGVIFFNDVGYLGMCGHGTIGLVATLAYLGKAAPGPHRIETPVGIVTAYLHPDDEAGTRVSVANVPSYRHRKDVAVNVDGIGTLMGDVAWGGNWFFLVDADGDTGHGQQLNLKNLPNLMNLSHRVRDALKQNNITGKDGAEIDHIELFGPSQQANGKSFVLCPGKAYDRSPCGTGTSAKLACLAADGKLSEGVTWKQESIIGSVFEGSVRIDLAGEGVHPTITGTAFVTAETTLIFDPRDPFVNGIG